MKSFQHVGEIAPLQLAYMVGRWCAIAQVEVNAGCGRGHAVEMYGLASASVNALQARGESIFDMATAVLALGNEIRREWPGTDLRTADERTLCLRAADGYLL